MHAGTGTANVIVCSMRPTAALCGVLQLTRERNQMLHTNSCVRRFTVYTKMYSGKSNLQFQTIYLAMHSIARYEPSSGVRLSIRLSH